MEGLTQSYMFNKKLLNCEPIDLSRFVFDLRDRHLEFWTLFSDGHESATAKRLLITSGAHCLHKELCLPILLIGCPDTCFLTFLEMSFAVWLVSNFVSAPFELKQQLGIPPLPLIATCVRLMTMSRMKKHVLFHCTNPQMVSLCRKYAFLFLLFYTRKTTNTIFSFMNLFYFMNRRAVILLD